MKALSSVSSITDGMKNLHIAPWRLIGAYFLLHPRLPAKRCLCGYSKIITHDDVCDFCAHKGSRVRISGISYLFAKTARPFPATFRSDVYSILCLKWLQ